MKDIKKTAIFGGTFNPPHIGHRAMLEYIAARPEIFKILIMPAKTPPHKAFDTLSVEHRVNMCRLAFEGVKKSEICLEELSIKGKSYTVNTLKSLRQKGIQNPALVIGADSLVNFHKWYNYVDILYLAELYVFGRDGISNEQIIAAKQNLENLGAKITLLDICPPTISSSNIRAAFLNNENISEFLNPLVLKYIKEHSLYKGEIMEPVFVGKGILYREEFAEYVDILKKRLSEKRFFHSLAVAKEALRLAEKYGCDTKKAFLAGLLHDICKDDEPNLQLQLLDEFGIILGNVEKNARKLWHAMAGAVYIKEKLKLNDFEIISAVRYHTTARANMSLLEKILYLADFTSEDRDYPGADDMRKAVDVSIEHAMREALIFTVVDLTERGMPVHSDTMDAYREIVKN
ncbi:MAG: nicotinate (nicotinamide) nucleotide adenylyltransferase [Clostridia bacterium]|nr:nicotinate (nicotinamide) nucleotide adenylyltransferase [Clostridia bacterium]